MDEQKLQAPPEQRLRRRRISPSAEDQPQAEVSSKRTGLTRMSRRVFVFICLLLTISWAEAQQAKKIPRIGYLSIGSGGGQRGEAREAFRQGLRELGYIVGQNIVIEWRFAHRKRDRLHALAAGLVRLKVDVIVALNPPTARAAKDATTTIPIVMRSSSDPIRSGFVASLARPGGNITGLWSISGELIGKRLELLKEVVPGLSRVAVLWKPGRRSGVRFKKTELTAKALGVQLQSLRVRDPSDFQGAFEAATRESAGALITLRNPVIVRHRKRIAGLALASRLPAIYDDRAFVEVGGLMSYGTNLAALHRRAAIFVHKILKGAKPADLPIEQAREFELVINLKTAKQLGVTIPPEVLYRADKVIK